MCICSRFVLARTSQRFHFNSGASCASPLNKIFHSAAGVEKLDSQTARSQSTRRKQQAAGMYTSFFSKSDVQSLLHLRFVRCLIFFSLCTGPGYSYLEAAVSTRGATEFLSMTLLIQPESNFTDITNACNAHLNTD